MKIEAILHPTLLDSLLGTAGRKLIVVIDVVRAATTICTALKSGARSVISVGSEKHARDLSDKLEDSLLAGERGGRMLEGFDLGNSPGAYRQDLVAGRDIVFSSSNFSRVLQKIDSDSAYVCGFVNISSLVNLICKEKHEEIALVCAANGDFYSREDALCAGLAAEKIRSKVQSARIQGDGLILCVDACRNAIENGTISESKGLESISRELMKKLGLERDMSATLAIDSVPVVPVARKIVIDGRTVYQITMS